MYRGTLSKQAKLDNYNDFVSDKNYFYNSIKDNLFNCYENRTSEKINQTNCFKFRQTLERGVVSVSVFPLIDISMPPVLYFRRKEFRKVPPLVLRNKHRLRLGKLKSYQEVITNG